MDIPKNPHYNEKDFFFKGMSIEDRKIYMEGDWDYTSTFAYKHSKLIELLQKVGKDIQQCARKTSGQIKRWFSRNVTALMIPNSKEIKKLCHEIANQNTAGTQYPIYQVMTKRVVTANPEYDDDGYYEDSEYDDGQVYVKDTREVANCTYFLTRKAAVKFMENNKHNLDEPHLWVAHCYRNYEMQMIVKHLFDVAGQKPPRFWR